MKTSIPALTATAFLIAGLGLPQQASAQDFGRMLGRLAERTAERAAGEVVDQATGARDRQSRRGPPDANDRARASGSANTATGVIAAPDGVEPWPVNAGHRAVVRPSQFVFSADLIEQRNRYVTASTYSCDACEGSQDVDSWQKALSPPRDTWSAWSALLETWTVGRVIDWRGARVDGRITVLSEIPVAQFRCRQLRLRVTTRGPNPVSTERPGLICLGRRDQYSGTETWHSVF